MPRLLAENGPYREKGAIDQAVDLAVRDAAAAGADVEVIFLRNYPINFCHNCRQCSQRLGDTLGAG